MGSYNGKYKQINNDDDILWAYANVPTIQAIVDKKADLVAKAILKEYTKDGDEIPFEKSPVLQVFANPHPLYNSQEFIKTMVKQWVLFKKVYVYKGFRMPATISKGDTLLVLPANKVKEIYKENVDIKETKEFIDHYEFTYSSEQGKETTITFAPFEIMSIKDTSITRDLFSVDDRYKTFELASNILLSAYRVRNRLQTKNGGFGIFSSALTKGEMDSVPELEQEDIEKLQKDLRKYGNSDDQYNDIVTSLPLKYQSTSHPIKDMDLETAVKTAKTDLCDILNFPIFSLNNAENPTYNNAEVYDRKLYTDSIIPIWNLFESEFNNQKWTSNVLKYDYSNIEAMQSDRNAEVETMQNNDNVWRARFDSGEITFNEKLIGMGLKEIENGNYYKKTNENTNN
jgi:hypothetical protein